VSTERFEFEPGEFSVPTADLCATNEVKCFARGGNEVCPGVETVDPNKCEEPVPEGTLVFCICVCHQEIRSQV
jgi:hypothetical protein